jgi:hypothetical protein
VTQLTRTQISAPSRTLGGVALAAALLGGVAGGAIQAISHAPTSGGPTISARDQALLQAGREWEERYRQMYPNSR